MYTIIATLFTYILIFISFFRCVAVPQTALPWCSNQRLCIPLDPGRVASCTGWWTCNYLPPTPDHMALPFLPAGHITPTFNALMIRANTPALQQLVQYMERQWINNQLHPVQSWSVYQQQIRTNNDVEGIIIHLTDRFSSVHATK